MSDFPALRLTVTNIASSSGAARLQVYSGSLPYQTLICQMELTAANNAALQTALANTAGTVTNFDFSAASSAVQGVQSGT